MVVLNVLDGLIILVILARSISPSHEITGADNLVEVIHHLIGEFGGEEGDGGSSIKLVSCFISEGFKFGDESIYFSWGKAEMTEFFLCALCGTSVLECLFECSGNSIPIVFMSLSGLIIPLSCTSFVTYLLPSHHNFFSFVMPLVHYSLLGPVS